MPSFTTVTVTVTVEISGRPMRGRETNERTHDEDEATSPVSHAVRCSACVHLSKLVRLNLLRPCRRRPRLASLIPLQQPPIRASQDPLFRPNPSFLFPFSLSLPLAVVGHLPLLLDIDQRTPQRSQDAVIFRPHEIAQRVARGGGAARGVAGDAVDVGADGVAGEEGEGVAAVDDRVGGFGGDVVPVAAATAGGCWGVREGGFLQDLEAGAGGEEYGDGAVVGVGGEGLGLGLGWGRRRGGWNGVFDHGYLVF